MKNPLLSVPESRGFFDRPEKLLSPERDFYHECLLWNVSHLSSV